MNSGIYQITNVLNGKKYIGSAKDLPRRKYQHWYHLKKGNHSNPHLQRSYNQSGSGAFHFMILEYCESELLIEREDYWINFLGTRDSSKGYNLCKANGTEISEETKKRLSSSLKGRVSPMLGKSFSEEHKRKISEAAKGRTHTDKTKAILAEASRGNQNRLGVPHTEEAKAKMSAAKKGKPAWNKGISLSEEQKSRLITLNKGNQYHKGKPHTEETKKKISITKKGKKHRRLGEE